MVMVGIEASGGNAPFAGGRRSRGGMAVSALHADVEREWGARAVLGVSEDSDRVAPPAGGGRGLGGIGVGAPLTGAGNH